MAIAAGVDARPRAQRAVLLLHRVNPLKLVQQLHEVSLDFQALIPWQEISEVEESISGAPRPQGLSVAQQRRRILDLNVGRRQLVEGCQPGDGEGDRPVRWQRLHVIRTLQVGAGMHHMVLPAGLPVCVCNLLFVRVFGAAAARAARRRRRDRDAAEPAKSPAPRKL